MESERCGVLMFDEDRNMSVHVSLAAARRGMEAIDVDNGEYRALFTADGRVVRVTTQEDDVLLAVTSERDEARLLALLHEYCPGEVGSMEDVRDFVNATLRHEWEWNRSRRPAWLHRRRHGSRPAQI